MVDESRLGSGSFPSMFKWFPQSPFPVGQPPEAPGKQGYGRVRAARPSWTQSAGPSGLVAARPLCQGGHRFRGTWWPGGVWVAQGHWLPSRAPTATTTQSPGLSLTRVLPHIHHQGPPRDRSPRRSVHPIPHLPGGLGGPGETQGEEGLGSLGIGRSSSSKPGDAKPVPGLTPKWQCMRQRGDTAQPPPRPPAHLPCYEVIEGQPQDGQKQEHGHGPAVPHCIHVDLRRGRGQAATGQFRWGGQAHFPQSALSTLGDALPAPGLVAPRLAWPPGHHVAPSRRDPQVLQGQTSLPTVSSEQLGKQTGAQPQGPLPGRLTFA